MVLNSQETKLAVDMMSLQRAETKQRRALQYKKAMAEANSG